MLDNLAVLCMAIDATSSITRNDSRRLTSSSYKVQQPHQQFPQFQQFQFGPRQVPPPPPPPTQQDPKQQAAATGLWKARNELQVQNSVAALSLNSSILTTSTFSEGGYTSTITPSVSYCCGSASASDEMINTKGGAATTVHMMTMTLPHHNMTTATTAIHTVSYGPPQQVLSEHDLKILTSLHSGSPYAAADDSEQEHHPIEGHTNSSCASNPEGSLNMRKIRGSWSREEDKILLHAVLKNGPRNWSVIASRIPGRTGKQARERWLNQLSPKLKKKNWKPEEDRIILETVNRVGNKWSYIAKLLPGRTDNSVKNRFNSTLRRITEKEARSKAQLLNH